MKLTEKELAYGLLRIAFGINFLGHGLFRILSGVAQFAAATAAHMTRSPLPHGIVIGFGYCIPWIEVVLGVGLILGLLTRASLVGGAIFMWALTFGVASNQDWAAAGEQLVYSVVFFVLLFLVEYNGVAVDGLLRRKKVVGFVPWPSK